MNHLHNIKMTTSAILKMASPLYRSPIESQLCDEISSSQKPQGSTQLYTMESGETIAATKESSQFVFDKKIGTGAYGIVYGALHKASGHQVAIKRNMVPVSSFGTISIRELDFLARTSGHPHIIKLLGVLFAKSGFPAHREKYFHPSKFSTDRMHLVMGKEHSNLEKAIMNQDFRIKHSPIVIKMIAAQILLACEWMHAHGVVHRDLKPSNILMSQSSTNIRICDFGLSGFLCGNFLNSPGLVTSWYRSPEICLKIPYSSKSDIWSVGAILFEMVSGKALLEGSQDDDHHVLTSILNKLPSIVSKETLVHMTNDDIHIQRFFQEKVYSRITLPARKMINDASLSQEDRGFQISCRIRDLMKMSALSVQSFNESEGGTLDEYCDLISEMLCFDPDSRIDATDALNHPFFRGPKIESYVQSIRSSFPPIPRPLAVISIHGGRIERNMAYSLAFNIFNNQQCIKWYSHRIIFHSLDLFERYLSYRDNLHLSCIQDNDDDKDEEVPPSREMTKNEVWIKFYVCLYLFHKLFVTLDAYTHWTEFVPREYQSSTIQPHAEEFEIFLIKDVCAFSMYRDTIYEILATRYAHHEVSKTCVGEALRRMGALDHAWSSGSIRGLYRYLFPEDSGATQILGGSGSKAMSPAIPETVSDIETCLFSTSAFP